LLFGQILQAVLLAYVSYIVTLSAGDVTDIMKDFAALFVIAEADDWCGQWFMT